MNIFENTVANIALMMFPILIYLFYSAESQNCNKKVNDLFLDFSLITSVYLIIRYGLHGTDSLFILLINVPLVIAFEKKREFISFVIFIIILICFKTFIDAKASMILIQFIVIYTLYFLNKKHEYKYVLEIYTAIKLIFILILITTYEDSTYLSYLYGLICVLSLYIVMKVVLMLLKKCEQILRLHLTIKELEQEEQFRESLFKITHEIKNPIAVCKAYLDMYNYENAEHQKFIAITKDELEKVLYLLQDFSSMSKINIVKEIIDINLFLEESLENYKPLIKNNNIEFQLEIDDDEIYINGDYNRLNQVVINIIKNSIESMDKSAKKIRITTKKLSNVFKIIFEDNGCGMNKETLDKFKDPFYTTKNNGTGLGVPLSFEIIKAHSGKISYSTKEGLGTSVIIELPILKTFA